MIALVTGANRGIGFEVCKQLSQNGLKVLLGGRDEGKARAAAQQLQGMGLSVEPILLDVQMESSVELAFKTVLEKHGKLDVLVNNAGGNYDFAVTPLQSKFDFFHQTMELNLLSAWRMTQTFLPLLKRGRSAKIVNVASGAGSFSDTGFGLGSGPGVTSYSLSKLALNGLTVKLAQELKEHGILVNSVCPGFTATQPGTAEMGARPVEEGAKSVVWAALLPEHGPTGGFFRDGKSIGW